MTNPRNWNDENINLDEIEQQKKELDQLKKSLGQAIKAQTSLTKELNATKLSQNQEQKKFAQEKLALQKQIEELNSQVDQLTASTEKLELDLINANQEMKNLTSTLEQKPASLNNVEVKEESNPTAFNEPLPTTQSADKAKASSYGLWRLLGYNNNQKNQAHAQLAELTKASVDQAIVENHSTLTHK